MHSDIKALKVAGRQSAQEMDEERQQNTAYEYLCHLEEAKLWMEAILKEPLPSSSELEENLRNGVFLAKIGNFIAPNIVPLSRIYDIFQHRYRSVGLQFRHTDNINYFIEALKSVNFPKMFLIETTDVNDKKNMPKIIYCIHALGAHLFRLGEAPQIEDLYGKVQFSKEEIDIMCTEIKKNSITLPSFRKIGSLLAVELLTGDAVSLQSGIINVNKAIDDESKEDLLKSLNSSSLSLVQVIPEYISHYLKAFKEVKIQKAQGVQNRSLHKSYEPLPDQDLLLNQSEIQGYIRKVNIDRIWQDVLNSIKKQNRENVKEIIATSFVDIKNFVIENIDYYVEESLSLDLNQVSSHKSRDAIQIILQNGNRNAKENYRVSIAVSRVKSAVLSGDTEKLLIALRSPSLKMSSQISDFAAPLYLEEMAADLTMSQTLTYKDIKSSVSILNEIAQLTAAVDGRDLEMVWRHLSKSEIPFMNVEPALKSQYFRALFKFRQKKLTQNRWKMVENRLLTFIDIQECIDETNLRDFHQTRALIYLEDINEAVQNNKLPSLIKAMEGLTPGEITPDEAPLYMFLLKKCLAQKQRNSDEELWLDDVKSVVEEVRGFKQKAVKTLEDLSEKQVPNLNTENILKSIENLKVEANYSNGIVKSPRKNTQSQNQWFIYYINGKIPVYLNTATKSYRWTKPTDNSENISFVTTSSSNSKIFPESEVSAPANSEQDLKSYVERITFLQAVIRGFLLRRKLKAAIIIQRWWRNIRRRQKSESCEVDKTSVPCDSEYYKDKVKKIIKIQSFWRGYQCRKNLELKREILQPRNPSFQYLKLLASSRQLNNRDYSTDLKIQTMKSSVVETIKRNQELACRLEEIDMKIGLLVQNRMSVEAIVAENKRLQNVELNGCESRGIIKAFSKEAKKLLEGYQQLFYLLQTDPAYLTRLIVHLPSGPKPVIQSCMLSLFNYGSNTRDAYLLLRLFRMAIFEEVQTVFQKPVDAVTGNPLLKLAVSFARQTEGYNPLRNILGFLVEKVLNDKVVMDINPVDIYRRWLNQMETESGKRSDLSPIVTVDEALTHPEVVSRLNHNIRILRSWVKCFLDRLSNCVNQFPYALRFITKLLKSALLQKFPQTPEKDILKIVGNIVYYQYINSAIVAPDAFYIISLPPDQHLKVEQRRNLANIAKILHLAATKKGFGEDSKHLMCLNPFIVDCHEEMKKFCRNCCDVEDLEEHFQITKYSEAALIDKPIIHITLEEIRECHKLLYELRNEVAPDPLDPVHEILDELGPPPSLATLIGCSDSSSDGTLSRAGKIEVWLELNNKFQVPPEEPTEAEKLFIKTKDLISRKLTDLHGETLTVAILDPKHVDIAKNLAKLELDGVVSSKDDYETILKSLIKDVTDKQEYRRLLNQEINALRTAQNRLNEKKKFYEDQLSYYEQYLNTCLSNLNAPSKTKQKKGRSVKYSGTRLRDKGILIALNGVPPGQLKNVQFEISTTPFNGIFSVQGRFMGIEVEKIDIDIQELLRLQFEGHREMDLFGKAQINVNLLLHLLNKKFHGRP